MHASSSLTFKEEESARAKVRVCTDVPPVHQSCAKSRETPGLINACTLLSYLILRMEQTSCGGSIVVRSTIILALLTIGAVTYLSNKGPNSLMLLLDVHNVTAVVLSTERNPNGFDFATDVLGDVKNALCLDAECSQTMPVSSTETALLISSSSSQTSSKTASMSKSASIAKITQTRSCSSSGTATKPPRVSTNPAPSCGPKVRRGIPMEVESRGGLTNRFRVILSYYKEARKAGRSLIVYWVPNRKCNDHFHNVFQLCALPDDLTILPALPKHHVFGTYRDYPGHPWRTDKGTVSLKIFKPTPVVQARINEFLAKLNGSFSAG